MLEKDKILVHELVFKSLEGNISPSECDMLQDILASGDEAISYYRTCVEVNRGLVKIKPILKDSSAMNMCLEEMAQYENQAETIRVIQEAPVAPKVQVRREPVPLQAHKTSRLSLYVAILSTAALLFLLLYVYINPKPVSQEVAVLTDSIDPVWVNADSSLKNGSRLMTGQGPSTLKQGIIKLLYDDGVQVVIEAPAEYELLTSTEIALRYGKLFASVSEAGKGFTVSTPNSRIIDLGTEFGVRAGTRGDTELHVFKGMTTLIAGLRNTEKELVEVHAGQARQIDTYNADIQAIQLDRQSFARSINSQTQTVWRGETTINLADILQGRLTPVQTDLNTAAAVRSGAKAINTVFVDQTPSPDSLGAPGFFLPVTNNPYINGIFLPNGADGPVALTADGSVRWNAPAAQVRQKIGLLRYDIASLSGSRKGAYLVLDMKDVVSPGKSVAVYGLLDESADDWPETKVHYANAPGFNPAPLGRFELNTSLWQRLGTMTFTAEGRAASDPVQVNLDDFMEQDTNNLLTLALIAENSDPSAEWRMTTKEGDPSLAPSLIFPCGDAADVILTTVTGNGADTYLSNDNQYNAVNSADPHGRETSLRVRNYWKDSILITDSSSFEYKQQDEVKTFAFRLGHRPVGIADNPVIALKAAAGITFDLQQMQARIPENRPAGLFTALCGMPEEIMAEAAAYNGGYMPRISVYVLVDGQERFARLNLDPRGQAAQIAVELLPADRYLTLAVTAAGDQKSLFDWCLFARPQVIFK